MQMPGGALYYESVPGDVREFVMRLLLHALPFATDTSQDAEVGKKKEKANNPHVTLLPTKDI